MKDPIIARILAHRPAVDVAWLNRFPVSELEDFADRLDAEAKRDNPLSEANDND